VARWLLQDDVTAEDAVQQSVIRALRYFEGLRNPEPRAWFVAIVRNAVQPSVVADQHQNMASLDDAIASLAPEFREVLVLRDIEGLDDAAVAQVLGAPKATVLELHASANEHLQRLVLASGIGPDLPPEQPLTTSAFLAWVRSNATRHRASPALLAAVKTQVALFAAVR